MAEGLLIQVTHTGLDPSSLLLTDVDDAVGDVNSFRKAGPVYIPVGGTEELVYTKSVAISFETGVIRQFINDGRLTASFLIGTALAAALPTVITTRGVLNANPVDIPVPGAVVTDDPQATLRSGDSGGWLGPVSGCVVPAPGIVRVWTQFGPFNGDGQVHITISRP